MVWAIAVLSSSQLLYQFSDFDHYAQALHGAAMATITGEPLGPDDGFAQTLEIVLAIFSVVVFATAAGSLGAFFLERRNSLPRRSPDQWVAADRTAADRSTRAVLESHLRNRRSGELDRDLAENYDEDVVVISAEGVSRGHEGVRRLAGILRSYVPASSYEYDDLTAEGPIGMLRWHARDAGTVVHGGADSYLIQHGKICAQTIHYSVATSSGDR